MARYKSVTPFSSISGDGGDWVEWVGRVFILLILSFIGYKIYDFIKYRRSLRPDPTNNNN
tara:strand:+ start:553 stop:732 length:180 start_codon:yes stop_codon:yes gene_type:complete